jgi:small-conductance mechanosensitive channel
MNYSSAHNLWLGLLADVQSSDFSSQLFMLAFSMVLGWAVSTSWSKRFSQESKKPEGLPLSADSFRGVVTPLLIAILIELCVLVVNRWHHVGLLRVAVPLLLSLSLIRAVFFLLRKAFVKQGRIGRLMQAFEHTFALIVWIGFALYVTGLWPELVQILEETMIPIGRHRESLLVVIQALLSVAVTVVLALWASAALEHKLMQLESFHSSLRVVIARAGRAFFLLLAILTSLSLVGIDLTVLSVFGGALGVGLGLGLQKLVSSYVSGIVILVERSLTLGDIISVDRFKGEVVQINARCTLLRGADGSETVIPNEMMVSLPVQNFSMSDRRVRLTTALMVAYTTDIAFFAQQTQQLLLGISRVLEDPAPELIIKRLAPEGLELELAFWIPDPELGTTRLISDVNMGLLDLIRLHKVQIPAVSEKTPQFSDQTDKSLIHKPLSD